MLPLGFSFKEVQDALDYIDKSGEMPKSPLEETHEYVLSRLEAIKANKNPTQRLLAEQQPRVDVASQLFAMRLLRQFRKGRSSLITYKRAKAMYWLSKLMKI